MTLYLFVLLAVIAVLLALAVVFSRNPIHSVLFLIGTFFAIAGQYVLLNAQFLAVVHIIVYAGAIMVLFLFVLMLLNLNTDTEPQKSGKLKLIASLAAGMLLLVFVAALKSTESIATPILENKMEIGLVENLGKLLFTEYVVPFELSSILFLAAIVGSVMIGKREMASTEF